MSGLGPTLYLPHGASASFDLRFTKPEDGSAVDLTGATAIDFYFKRTSTLDDDDAALHLEVAAGLTVIDALAGIVRAAVTAAQCAALEGYGEYFYYARAALADGSVIIPDNLRGTFITDLESAEEQELDGDAITRLDAANGTLTPVTPDMSNYTINRYDLTGLTGGASTDLDGLAEATLDALQNGAIFELFFTGSISARFRLRAMVGTEAESSPWLIICDNDTTRVFELIGVTKAGAPCVWNPDTEEFHQQLASGTPAVPAMEETGFTLPA